MQMMSEVLVTAEKIPLQDHQVPGLKCIDKTGKERGKDTSRYDFNKGVDNESLRNRNLSEDEVKKATSVSKGFLDHVLEDSEKTGKSVSTENLKAIYDLALGFGLSRLEVENLADYSKTWLEFCLAPNQVDYISETTTVLEQT